jgi:hypothetical protein
VGGSSAVPCIAEAVYGSNYCLVHFGGRPVATAAPAPRITRDLHSDVLPWTEENSAAFADAAAWERERKLQPRDSRMTQAPRGLRMA